MFLLKALPELISAGILFALWAEPWRGLAGAVLYFAIMGLSRPLFARWQAEGGSA